MKLPIFLCLLLITYTAHGNLQLRCFPKPGCDLSNCGEIPDNLKELEGFNVQEYRKRNEYHIICKQENGEREETSNKQTTNHLYQCKPKDSCNFSNCDPIPPHLTEIQGFDVELFRTSDEYFIQCENPVVEDGDEITNLKRAMREKEEEHSAEMKELRILVMELKRQLEDMKDEMKSYTSKANPDKPFPSNTTPMTTTSATLKPALCKSPKVHTNCASHCPPTCLVPNPDRCIRACKKDVFCICPKHMVQMSNKNDTCTDLSKCPDLVRLVDGGLPNQGRVEILYNEKWGTVCDDHWDLKDADVVCRMLGFKEALNAFGGARFGRGEGEIWLDDVQCRGHEDSITSCGHRKWGKTDCSHHEDASVVCDPN